ncbi:MAG: arginine--tRNA ligase, partial [Verrucomicrobiales bacterium]|nr:arginine--tRNA ligase [Verrucomicrobiales bacterium]
MTPFPQLLAERLTTALETLEIDLDGFTPAVSQATDPRFGHYQSNAAMVLAKRNRENPRLLAERLVDALKISDLCEKPEIAGPGFLNFRLKNSTVSTRTTAVLNDRKLGVPQVENPQRIVVDFSAPNVAKPMHIGHLRSTIIGDSLARVARFVGHHVITDNHIGDWGTQFGMIIHGWKTELDRPALDADPISELVRVYRHVNALTKDDPAILETCKNELVKLQAGDPDNLAIWQETVDLSLRGLQEIYAWLDIHFDHYLGESAYNDRLAPLVDDLLKSGIAELSDGAVCIFYPDDKDLKDRPALIRKADGGFLYATTDLATIDYRIETWGADQIWYVVGAPQSLHFQQIFNAAKQRGQATSLTHVAHGSILGSDRKLMRTRSGDNVGLLDVLREAVDRARKVVDEKQPDL